MPQGRGLLPSPLVKPREIEVRVGILRIELKRAQIRINGILETSEILQGDAEVEGGNLMVGIEFESAAVVLFRGRRRAILVKEATEVYVRVDVIGIDPQQSLVHFPRILWR